MSLEDLHPPVPVVLAVGPEDDVGHVVVLQPEAELGRPVVDVRLHLLHPPADESPRGYGPDVVLLDILVQHTHVHGVERSLPRPVPQRLQHATELVVCRVPRNVEDVSLPRFPILICQNLLSIVINIKLVDH